MKVDLKKLRREKKKNFQERLDFISRYVEWLKKTPNKKWSTQQNKVISQSLKKRRNPVPS